MFNELIDLFTLLATLPNRVVLSIATFVVVAFLFALELAAPLIVLVGVVLKASALPCVRSSVGRALPRPPGARRAGATWRANPMLERHRLTDWCIAMGSFPRGWERRHWLVISPRYRTGR